MTTCSPTLKFPHRSSPLLSHKTLNKVMKNTVRIIVLIGVCLGFAASVQAQPRTITNGLVVHLTFDNTLVDNSGRGNNGTYNSTNGLVTNPPAPTYVAGKLG